MAEEIVSRPNEIKTLGSALEAREAEFLAVYGRRRIGKTFLISSFFSKANCVFFQATGLKDGSLAQQLDLFNKALIKAFTPGYELMPPKKWMHAFEQLDVAIGKIPRNRRIVLFFDELPWLATPRSGLIQALDHYWNTRWSRRNKLILIACGSAAAWMLDNLINAKGGLHNRVTRRLHLDPYTLSETRTFLASRSIDLSPAQVLQVYMALGGVPYYLKQLRNDQSIVRNINELCFRPKAPLVDEFEQLFASLFKNYEAHVEIIRVIGKQVGGVTREQIAHEAKSASDGGRLTERLEELKSAGFIVAYKPYGHTVRGTCYKVIDEYALFYLSWIEPFKKKFAFLARDGKFWENHFSSQQYKIWSGYAFETVCLKHVDKILDFLDIGHLVTAIAPWHCRPEEGGGKGAQIDLLIERSDDVITLCEIKHHEDIFVVDKACAEQIQGKITAFKNATGTKKTVEVLFITVNGVKHNKYTASLNSKAMELADFF